MLNLMSSSWIGTTVSRLRFKRRDGAVIILQLRLEHGEWLLRVWRVLGEELVLGEES